MKIVFDGDMILFRACSAVEREIQWNENLWTLHSDAAEAKEIVDNLIASITEKVLNHYNYGGMYSIHLCFSAKRNFRYDILPTYKLNRAGRRKPLAYYGLLQWALDNYDCITIPNLEADDIMGLNSGDDTVLVSGDKDFKTIPGHFYNFLADEFYDITKEEADYWHLYQTLVGDVADNYKGCPGIGAVSAKKLLDTSPTWQAVVEAFAKKKLDENEALLQARVARILRPGEYNYDTQEIMLWTPNSHT